MSDGRTHSFDSGVDGFFPLDKDAPGGWPLTRTERNHGGHKFWFTTEYHGEFVYRGGEVFKFSGDDDFWAFVGGQLAIDLGGLHPAQSATLHLDRFRVSGKKLAKGQSYSLDIFHAERHTDGSNFRIDTSIDFVGLQVSNSKPTQRRELRSQRLGPWERLATAVSQTVRSVTSKPCSIASETLFLEQAADSEFLKRASGFLKTYHPDKRDGLGRAAGCIARYGERAVNDKFSVVLDRFQRVRKASRRHGCRPSA
jgi:fibro-slime domain-containing protein